MRLCPNKYHYFTSDRFPYSADIFVKASKAMNVEFGSSR